MLTILPRGRITRRHTRPDENVTKNNTLICSMNIYPAGLFRPQKTPVQTGVFREFSNLSCSGLQWLSETIYQVGRKQRVGLVEAFRYFRIMPPLISQFNVH